MSSVARLILSLAAVLLGGGCRLYAPARSLPAPEALAPSPRLIVGRIITFDPAPGFAFVELAADAPKSAMEEGTELIVRTPELRETARLRASRFVRGRTLGAKIIQGKPSPGDEVVWQAP